ncbi:hypothetical protein BAE44_0010547 [Dichanthelium oligosanthes]|uniref:Secreted protein n=1 Tax=Dichanthelium oligosanthes TaxID=888268 RepID=A0A1E5VTI6_9POAL|nr:hypothetical protein BAE44_0010547 [Dichanthelium oligosanthes]
MRSFAICAPFVCALLLLHCLVCTPRAPADRDGSPSRDSLRFQLRKLLRITVARTARTQQLNAAAAAAAAEEDLGAGVGASLKKQTPSKSNPKQN